MDEKKYNLEQSIAELGKLLDLSAKETDKATCEVLAEKAKIIYEKFPESEEIALQYARILFNLSVEQDNVEDLLKTSKAVKQIFESFKHSESIALRYAMALVNLSVEQDNVEDLLKTSKAVKQIFESFKHSEDIALHYAMALANLSFKQDNVEDLLKTSKAVKQIFESFKHSESIALRHAMALVSLSFEQDNVEDRLNTANAIKQIFESFKHSESIALRYAMALVNLSAKQDNVEDRLNTANAIKQIFESFKHSEDIALHYAMALANLSLRQDNVEDLLKTSKAVKQIFESFKHSEDIALRYVKTLVNLSTEQDNVEDRSNTVNEIKQFFDSFNHSESFALHYAMALVNLSAKQDNVEDRLNTVNSVKEIFELFRHSEDIALQYAKTLFNLSNLQNDIKQKQDIVNRILDILKNFSSVEILNILVDILQNNSDITLDTYKIPTTSLTKILDKLCFYSNEDLDRKLLIRALNLDLVINTKYDILKDWIKHYKDDENKLNQLIDIYRIVQEIKYQLGLKAKDKDSNLKFGHYTKGKTLQNLLDQDTGNTDDTKFSVSGKTRLYNANYMNDPEEGVVIEEILEPSKDGERTSYFEKRNILDPSPWFLMSFTSKTDDLTMWSQYGDDAQGICLVLKEDDFSRFTSFNDVSWRRETTSLEFIKKIDLSMSELSGDLKVSANESKKKESTFSARIEEIQPQPEKKDKVAKGNIDYLYRIAYVKNTGENFELEKTELFDGNEITKLKESVNNLKQKLYERVNDDDDFYKKAISNCIEEIRYLFKSVDYKYENELRILRYANLDPSNDKIKIDKTSGIGRLYVERENSIQIDEVIFGPKFPNPEYVTPLLKLLDKEINYKKSTIKFR